MEQIVHQCAAARLGQTLEIVLAQLGRNLRESLDHALGFGRQHESICTRVGGMIMALNPTRPFEPLGLSTYGNALNLKVISQIALRAAGITREMIEKQPLRTSKSKPSHPSVELPTSESADIIQEKAEALFDLRRRKCHSLFVS